MTIAKKPVARKPVKPGTVTNMKTGEVKTGGKFNAPMANSAKKGSLSNPKVIKKK